LLDQIHKERTSSQQMEDTNITREIAPGVKTCIKIHGLDAIKETDTELVIWHRTLPPGFKEWIDKFTPSSLPQLRVFIAPGDIRLALNPMLDECGLPKDSMRELMISDITDLAYVFSRITNSKRVDLRLENINNDSCWRFHIDYVEARLLTTYRGATTQWVQPAYAKQALNEQKEFSGPLERLDIDDVAIFNGKSAAQANGIVHRSPPIVGTGQSRLLFCLNKQSELSPDPWDNS
jgi:hypothetical protein